MDVLDTEAGRSLLALVQSLPRRSVIAVDGPDAAGKSTLADALRTRMGARLLRASIDDWHRPRAERSDYYRDSFDLPRLVSELVVPFRSGASSVRIKAFDHRTDRVVSSYAQVADDVLLVLDGVFLLRPELLEHWTLTVYLDASEQLTLRRASLRDGPASLDRYRERYLPGQRAYRAECDPTGVADLVLSADALDIPVASVDVNGG